MHGPPASYTGDLYKAVVWPDLPRIKVLDTIALELSPRRAKKWRALRDEALRRWTHDGFILVVKEDRASKYPAYDPSIADEYERLSAPQVPGVARLMKTRKFLQGTKVSAFALWAAPGTWATFKMGKRFWLLRTRSSRQHVVTHELGHALFGLQDRYALPNPADRTGVMAQGQYPDEHDFASIKDYWGVA